MIRECIGDILTAPVTAPTVLLHQVNCIGVMGAGLAAHIKLKYPKAFEEYAKVADMTMLGITQVVPVTALLSIGNLFGQKYTGIWKRQTDYNAFRKGCESLLEQIPGTTVIRMPYKIGCGLAGGDWNVVSEIVKDVFKDRDVEVWKLP